MFDPASIIATIVGKPPDQPALVVDRPRRQAKLEADARILYRPWSPRRATPAPGPPPPLPRCGIGCRVCGLVSCVCPKR
jgi:hypothetical protein